MTSTFALFTALFLGVATGAFFFGGLWLTVRYLLRTRLGAVWFALSYFLRLALAGLVLYWITDHNALRAVAAVSGFFIASVFARMLGLRDREVSHAPEP